jgi:hypothetical protein
MPYRNLISDILDRFNETNSLLNIIKSNELAVIPPANEPLENKILKGLFYVSLYSCIEYTFKELSIRTLSSIKSKNILYEHFENKFLTIALSSSLQTIRDCNSKKFLDKASDIFLLSESNDVAIFNETFVNQYLQNIWGKSFNQLTKTFGVVNFLITPREITIFDEIVENRNIVAHGRELSSTIGSSPKYTDLKSKYDIIFDTLNRYILHFERFYNNKEFVKITERGGY